MNTGKYFTNCIRVIQSKKVNSLAILLKLGMRY